MATAIKREFFEVSYIFLFFIFHFLPSTLKKLSTSSRLEHNINRVFVVRDCLFDVTEASRTFDYAKIKTTFLVERSAD